MFVDKAADLGTRLLRAFETPSGIPFGSVNLNGRGGSGHNAAWTGNSAVLSELGTLQVGDLVMMRHMYTCIVLMPTLMMLQLVVHVYAHQTVGV